MEGSFISAKGRLFPPTDPHQFVIPDRRSRITSHGFKSHALIAAYLDGDFRSCM